MGGGGGGGLFEYSVKPGPDLSRSRLSLAMLVTKWAKARYGQVDDQVSQFKDQVLQVDMETFKLSFTF